MSLEDSQRKLYWSASFLFNLIAVWFIQPLRAFFFMYAKVEPPVTEAGLIEVSTTLASFSPIYGIGLSIALIVLFVTLATSFGAKAESCK